MALLALVVAIGCAGLRASAAETVAATVSFVDVTPARPPLNRLRVDLRLENDGARPRWVLFPSKLPTRDDGGGVDTLEQLTVAAGAAAVSVGRFLGRAGTYALELAPGARVTLRKLEIGWWREGPWVATELAFDIRLAGEVRIDDRPIVTWFDGDPLIRGSVEVDMATAEPTHPHSSPHNRELPLVAVDAAHLVVTLAVP